MIAHLTEIDKRKLFAEEGCSSLKSYCMEVLHLSEDQAYSRIGVARLVQKFPGILEMLADGLVHLTAVHRLGPLQKIVSGCPIPKNLPSPRWRRRVTKSNLPGMKRRCT